MMNRTEMIGRLVAVAVDTAVAEPQSGWLKDVFERGFRGYEHFSDRQLQREMQMRGIVVPDDAADQGAQEDNATDILALWIPDLPHLRESIE